MTRLVRREVVADGTLALWFEKPKGFVFETGRTVTISLVAPTDTDAAGQLAYADDRRCTA